MVRQHVPMLDHRLIWSIFRMMEDSNSPSQNPIHRCHWHVHRPYSTRCYHRRYALLRPLNHACGLDGRIGSRIERRLLRNGACQYDNIEPVGKIPKGWTDPQFGSSWIGSRIWLILAGLWSDRDNVLKWNTDVYVLFCHAESYIVPDVQ